MSESEIRGCKVRRQLAEEFARAARLYAEAVVQLTRDPATMPGDGYQRLCATVDQAHERSEQADRAFQEHVASHGCGGPTGVQHGAAFG